MNTGAKFKKGVITLPKEILTIKKVLPITPKRPEYHYLISSSAYGESVVSESWIINQIKTMCAY